MQFRLRTIIQFCILAVIISSNSVDGRAEQIIKTDELPADTLIVLQRGACERRCAVYKVVVFADGSVIFDGLGYVRKPGVTKAKISLEALKALLAEADAIRFYDLQVRYDETSGCDMVDAEAPSATITIGTGGRSKTIRHSLGCSGAEPGHLKDLEDKIATIVGLERWLK